MTIRIIDRREAIDDMTVEWRRLLQQSDCHRAFSSPDWYGCYLSVYADCQPLIIVLEQAGHVTGIAPLVRDPAQLALRMLDDLADYQDVIVARNDLQAIGQLVQAAASLGDCQLRGLRPGANLLRAFADHPDLPLQEHLDDARSADQTCYYSDLSNGYQAFLATRSGNFRFNLRKAKRRAAEHGIQIVELKADDISGEELAEHFLRLHLLRFPDRLFSRPQPQAFCRQLLPAIFQQGLLRAFALRQGEQVMGLHLSVCDRHALGIWNGGFDPAIAAIAPGKLLIDAQIQACCDGQLKEFDFLRGDEAYKKSWSSAGRRNRELRLSAIK
ncbi:MAG: GNAT family N-acetyltransferase [Wenzhouxiangellaceae bacterium]